MFDLTAPPNATALAWCGVVSASLDGTSSIEFELRVRTTRTEIARRRVISARGLRTRWRRLRLRVREAGAVRITLTTRAVRSSGDGVPRAVWKNPRVTWPRPLLDALARVRAALTASNIGRLWHKLLPPNSEARYRLWAREQQPSRHARRAQREWSSRQSRVFTLITFVPDGAEGPSHATWQSVVDQTYGRWEWLLVAPAIAGRGVAARVRPLGDERIRVVSTPAGNTRGAAWNAALRECRGEHAALLDDGDRLAPHALYQAALAFDAHPDMDVLYSDEDRIGNDGRRHGPRFKPDWSPELLLSVNYIGRLAVLRVSSVLAAGGFHDEYGGAEEWALLLRLSHANTRIRRMPFCLYHRAAAPIPERAAVRERVLRDHCESRGCVLTRRADDEYRITWLARQPQMVSIIIPNRNAGSVLRPCIEGIATRTAYPNREIIIVDNDSSEQDVLELYRIIEESGTGRVVPFNRVFNFSAACNAGAAVARGELLLFLNNDIAVIEESWLDELVAWALAPDVGVAGPKLLYPDGTVQHAGVVFGLGLVGHIFARTPEWESGVFGSASTYRNYLAVTGACQIVRADVFRRLGGYDERFRLSFSDVVLCLEARKHGLRVVYTPHARLVHHESFTRKREDFPEDLELLARYLKSMDFVEDPYFHPELDPTSPRPAVRSPFDARPQQVIRGYIDRLLACAAAEG